MALDYIKIIRKNYFFVELFFKIPTLGYMNSDNKKYIFVLFITIGIFLVVFGFVNFLNNKRVANIDDLQRKITADLIATETQFELLKTAPCSALGNSVLSKELEEFGRKLDFTQQSQGADDPDVLQLKKYYSLLQVKDYLLMQELSGKCDTEIHSLLYFYASDCDECLNQGYILTEFKKEYPELRIYSFDSDLDFSVIGTFASLYDFQDVYPTLIIDDEIYQGFMDEQQLEELFPDLIANKEHYDIVESGKLFIRDKEVYSEFGKSGLVFVSHENDYYTYAFVDNAERVIEEAKIIYDLENKLFTLPPEEGEDGDSKNSETIE